MHKASFFGRIVLIFQRNPSANLRHGHAWKYEKILEHIDGPGVQ